MAELIEMSTAYVQLIEKISQGLIAYGDNLNHLDRRIVTIYLWERLSRDARQRFRDEAHLHNVSLGLQGPRKKTSYRYFQSKIFDEQSGLPQTPRVSEIFKQRFWSMLDPPYQTAFLFLDGLDDQTLGTELWREFNQCCPFLDNPFPSPLFQNVVGDLTFNNAQPAAAVVEVVLPDIVDYSQLPNEDVLQCTICLNSLEDKQSVRRLPCVPIVHTYHSGCIDRWLEVNSTCPFDRNRVIPAVADVSNENIIVEQEPAIVVAELVPFRQEIETPDDVITVYEDGTNVFRNLVDPHDYMDYHGIVYYEAEEEIIFVDIM